MRGWAIAHYLVSQAERLSVATVIFDGRIWTARRSGQGWRDYDVDTSDVAESTAADPRAPRPRARRRLRLTDLRRPPSDSGPGRQACRGRAAAPSPRRRCRPAARGRARARRRARREEQRQVGDPQPQQEHDGAGQRAVGLVVAGEVGDVEAERGRGHDPGDDREDGPEADPAELGLLDVGRRPVEDRHDQHHDQQQHRPLRDAPDRHARSSPARWRCRRPRRPARSGPGPPSPARPAAPSPGSPAASPGAASRSPSTAALAPPSDLRGHHRGYSRWRAPAPRCQTRRMPETSTAAAHRPHTGGQRPRPDQGVRRRRGAGARARRGRRRPAPRRVHRHHGPLGLGQVDPDALPGGPRHPHQRRGRRRRHRR